MSAFFGFRFPLPTVLLLLTAILCGFVPGSCEAQVQTDRRTIEGVVRDEAGRPVRDATVALKRAGFASTPVAFDVTDREGRFAFRGAPSGGLQVTVSHVAYGATTIPVPESATEVDVVLSEAGLSYPEIEVTATRGVSRVSPVTVTNVDAGEIERAPANKDLPAQLDHTPSVTQYSENGNGLGYTYLRLRGFDQKRVAVTINGIPQNDPETFDVFWINFFDLQGAITDVQIQRGASGSFYGSTGIGGGINIMAMPYRRDRSIRAGVGYGSFDTRSLSVEANSGLIAGRYQAFGRFSRVLSDGYRDWSWAEYYRYFAGVRRVSDRSVLTVQAFGGPQRDGLAYVGIPKDANTATITDDFGSEIDRRFNVSAFTKDVERFRQPHFEVHHELALADHVDLTQRFFLIRGTGHFDFDGSFRSANYLRLPDGAVDPAQRDEPLYVSMPGTAVLFRAALDQWQVGAQPGITIRHDGGLSTLGGEARLHRSLRWGRIQESDGLPADLVGSDSDVRVYSVRGEKVVGSLFGSHLRRVADAFVVQADAALTARQYRVYDEAYFGTDFTKAYVFFNPRFGVTVFPDRPLSVYASVALANREPRLKALYDGEEAGAGAQPQFERDESGAFDYSRPLVGSESVLDLELGARYRSENAEATVGFYYMDFRDEIVPSGGLDQFGIPRTGNAPETRHAGVEADGRLRVAPALELWANTSLSRNRFVEFSEFVFDGDAAVPVSRDGNAIAGFPGFIFNGGIRISTRNLSLDLSVRHRGRQYVDNSNGRDPDGVERDNLVVDPYTLADVTFRYDVAGGPLDGVSVAIDLVNLTNRRVLLSGNSGFGAPQFFPAATRHAFLALTYELD